MNFTMTKVQKRLQWMMQLVCGLSLFLMLFVLMSPIANSRSRSVTKENCRQIVENAEGGLGRGELNEPQDIVDIANKTSVDTKEIIKEAKPNPPQNPKPKVNQKAKPQGQAFLLKGPGNASEAFEEFIKLRPHSTLLNDFDFLVSGENICADKNVPFLLVLCFSSYLNMDRREIIRKTWAQVAKNGTWPLRDGSLPVKIAFILGNPGTSAVKNAIVKEENEKFRDIVLVNVDENAHSHSKLVMAGLKWVENYCNMAKFILKVSEKTMVHLPNLIAYLKPFRIPERGLFIGYMYPNRKALRGGEWAVNQTIYPFELYPPHLDGSSYVISGNAVSKLYYAAEHLPYIFIENVFITGISREAIGAEIKHKAEFATKQNRHPGLCSLHKRGHISVTNIRPAFQIQIWEALQQETCNEN